MKRTKPGSQWSRFIVRKAIFVIGACLIGVPAGVGTCSAAFFDPPREITTVEGITEYRLDNGLQVLLFPDSSKPVVTVNLTIFVGSRHEGYGEAGMAHLLEHMLFKGTPNHQEIPKLLSKRGADFNGTTWLDRTNYYETLPAEGDNLEFAIRLEADRMVNSYVKGEDLLSEMTVVRSEFEQGEDSPASVLSERIYSAAFRWHNYGQTTIGNQSDIERVPIDRLQAFYRKYYRPDNAMLVVAGAFDPAEALATIDKYFGLLENPKTPLEATYTQEPPQDGERTTVVRRVAQNQYVGAGYHVPAGSHPDFAAVHVLNNILSTEPSGRLYKALVQTKKASAVSGDATGQHDPGLAIYIAEVPQNQSIEESRQALIATLEGVAETPITQAEVDRAIAEFQKARELQDANSTSLATLLSEWGAQGDWRLYFLFRDRVEKVTAEDVQRVAQKYFVRNNRTVGLFLPTESSERITVPPPPNIKEMLAEYRGREAIAEGEAIANDLSTLQSRVESGELKSGVQFNFLPKKSRGEMVNLLLLLRFGDEASMRNRRAACDVLGAWMRRGTEKLDYQTLQDRLSQLRATVQIATQPGLLQVQVATKRTNLPELMPIIRDMLRNPRFAEEELEVIRTELLTNLESQATEPQALAPLAVTRALNPYTRGDVRYVGTIEEQVEDLKKLTAEQIKSVYRELVAGTQGELIAVGDFEPAEVKRGVEDWLRDWKSQVVYQRVSTPANTKPNGSMVKIETPDKANSVYFASQQYAMREDDPDYIALAIGNYILGGGTLSSRLGDRVRQQDGLSYGIGSGLNAHPVDPRTSFLMFAIANPENQAKLVKAIQEEVTRLVERGVTTTELEEAKQGFLQSLLVERSSDSALANLLASNMFAKRDMAFQQAMEKRIRALKVDEVNQALKKYLDFERLIIATAGDFSGKSGNQP